MTIAGITDDFILCDFGGQSFTPTGTLFVQVIINSGSASRQDVGGTTYTNVYYQSSAGNLCNIRTGYTSFYLTFSSGCDAGSYTSGSVCTDCPAGSYTASTNSATSCTQCAPGTFQPNTGSTSCSACPDGRYQSQWGFTSCVFCPAGQYQPSSSATACLTCPAGQYQLMSGQIACVATVAPTVSPTRITMAPTPAPTTSPTMAHITTVTNGLVSTPVLRTELIVLNGVSITSIDGGRRLLEEGGKGDQASGEVFAELMNAKIEQEATNKKQQAINEELRAVIEKQNAIIDELKEGIEGLRAGNRATSHQEV